MTDLIIYSHLEYVYINQICRDKIFDMENVNIDLEESLYLVLFRMSVSLIIK